MIHLVRTNFTTKEKEIIEKIIDHLVMQPLKNQQK